MAEKCGNCGAPASLTSQTKTASSTLNGGGPISSIAPIHLHRRSARDRAARLFRRSSSWQPTTAAAAQLCKETTLLLQEQEERNRSKRYDVEADFQQPKCNAIKDGTDTTDDDTKSSDPDLYDSGRDYDSDGRKLIRPDAPLASTQHLGSSRQYWRDIILGVNDGIISTFLLVAGVAGGGLTSVDILLTAIAGALAGAVSMCAGEYVATKSQNEVMHGEIALEKEHIKYFIDDEIRELGALLEIIGISEGSPLSENLLQYYRKNPESLLKIMIALEFGVLEEEVRSPICAGLTSCSLFFAGSLPSVIPFLFSGDRPLLGLVWAAFSTLSALLIVGGIKTWATRGNWLNSALENLIIAGFGGIFAYFVGLFFDSILRNR